MAASATRGPVDAASLRLVHITNTRDLASLEISHALVAECHERDDLTLIGEEHPLGFAEGALTSLRPRR